MEYPKEILPKKGFVVPFPFNTLISTFGDYVLCCRIVGSVEENSESGTFNGQKKLKEACFEHVVHQSMNLHGGHFQPHHVKFVQKNAAQDSWNGESDVSLEEYEDLIIENSDAVPIFYRASKLCQPQTTPWTFQNKDSYNSALKLFPAGIFPPYTKGASVDLPTEIRIKHMPTNTNYWHVQMEVYPIFSEVELKDNSAKWRERIFNQVKAGILCRYYEVDPPFEYKIPEEIYNVS